MTYIQYKKGIKSHLYFEFIEKTRLVQGKNKRRLERRENQRKKTRKLTRKVMGLPRAEEIYPSPRKLVCHSFLKLQFLGFDCLGDDFGTKREVECCYNCRKSMAVSLNLEPIPFVTYSYVLYTSTPARSHSLSHTEGASAFLLPLSPHPKVEREKRERVTAKQSDNWHDFFYFPGFAVKNFCQKLKGNSKNTLLFG